MALRGKFMACIVVVACAAAMAEAAITCSTVTSKLSPCITYLTSRGAAPPAQCCAGVQALYSMAQTTPDRQQACQCLQSEAKGISAIKPDLATSLPRACGINLPFPITSSINCNSIS